MAKPSPSDVAMRLLILKYQIIHALAIPPQELLQSLFSKWSEEEQWELTSRYKEKSNQLVAFLKFHNLWDLMTEEEKEFIQSVPPKVKKQQHINAMWNIESAVVLMWALGLIKAFPPFDEQTDPEILKRIPYQDINNFVSSAKLLPEEVIEEKRSLAELWHWRSRTRQLQEMGRVPPRETGYSTFDEIVRAVAYEAYKRGDLSRIVDYDFLAKSKAYRELDADEWAIVQSITIERHRALNWLCGYAPGNKWDKTPTDT